MQKYSLDPHHFLKILNAKKLNKIAFLIILLE